MITLEKITDITNSVLLGLIGLTHAVAIGALGLALVSAPGVAPAAPGALVQAYAEDTSIHPFRGAQGARPKPAADFML